MHRNIVALALVFWSNSVRQVLMSQPSRPTRLCIISTLLLAWLVTGTAILRAEAPRLQAVPQPHDQISLERDGDELARYHFGSHKRRPFLFPLRGPSGRVLTRLGHPHDPEGHSHHLSFWVSHHDVAGVSFWADTGKGRIVHQRIDRLVDGDQECSLHVTNHWVAEDDGVLLEERRTVRLRSLAQGEWLLVLDISLSARERPITLGKTPFGMLGVRMAKSIGVHDGGGTIRNSAGGVNEEEVFWKPARWVDYSGPVAATTREGITLMDHPGNPNHPSTFHVRDDGWMGASLTFDGPRTINPDRPLVLRYGLYVHRGVPQPSQLETQWQSFAKLEAPVAEE